MKKPIILLIFLFLALVLHVFLMSWSIFRRGKPDFLLLLVIFWSWRRGGREGTVVGFVAGLLMDLFFSPLLGLYSFSFALIGFLIGEVRERVYRENILIFLIVIAAVSLLSRIITSAWLGIFGISSFLPHLDFTLFPAPLYNCLLAFFVLLAIESWAGRRRKGAG